MWWLTSACVQAPLPRSDALWFVLIDRFADELPDAPATTDRADPQAWHGGDLVGLRSRLPHLRDLGLGALWISPVTKTRDQDFHGHGAFHGYWTIDPQQVEPRFGSEGDLRRLSDDLHQHGERLWVDVVWNHVGYESSAVANHPEWFHQRGDITRWDDPIEVVTHDVHGLPDLAQEHPEVAAWLGESARWLRAASLADGFRVDAVRHLEPGFVADLGAELRSTGPFELLGEVFDGDGGAVAARAQADRLDHVFDFPLHFALVEAMCGDRPLAHVPANLPARIGGAIPVTLVDNHDLPRIASRCGGPDGAARALAVSLAMRGHPSLTWGTEHALDGAAEPANRADQPWDRGPGVLAPTLRALLAFRARHGVLVDGDSRTAWLDDDTWVLWRTGPTETVVVVVNRGESSIDVDPHGLDGSPSEALAVHGRDVTTDSDVVPANGVWWGAYPGPVPAAGVVELALTVAGAPPGELRWVGPTAVLAGWSPASGARGPVVAREGDVLVGKAVVVAPDGTVTWDPGPDRVLVVGADRGPRSGTGLAVVWGQGP